MVKAWYMADAGTEDQILPLHLEPDQPVSLKTLQKIGLEYYFFPAETYENNSDFQKLKKERGYSYEDVIIASPNTLPNYEQKIKAFFQEHLHTDEEIRYVIDGTGYFDVRDDSDKWIRIQVERGDLIVLPAGIYHRFTLDEKNYIKVLRLFVGEPVWTPHNRPCDEMPARRQYVKHFVECVQ